MNFWPGLPRTVKWNGELPTGSRWFARSSALCPLSTVRYAEKAERRVDALELSQVGLGAERQ
jgi:hypothetical protein